MENKQGYVIGALLWMSALTGLGVYTTMEVIDTDKPTDNYSIHEQVQDNHEQALTNKLMIQSMKADIEDYEKKMFGWCSCIRTENHINERRYCEFRCDTESLVTKCEERHIGFECG